jgi:hypothetical protein
MPSQKKIIILSILFCLLIEPVISQDLDINKEELQRENIRYPNIVKINSLALVFNNLSLLYERGIIPRVSAGIGVGYKYAGAAPNLFTVENSTISVQYDKIKGFTITPEARYYIKSCDPGKLEGFYAGLYLRYTGYTTSADFEYIPEDDLPEFYNSDIALREFGVGIQLGYQLIIKERFSIDFLFLGPRFSSYNFSYEFDQEPSQEFLDDLSEYLNEVVDRFGLDYNVDIQKEGEAKASTTFSFANVRFGLSLGFAF